MVKAKAPMKERAEELVGELHIPPGGVFHTKDVVVCNDLIKSNEWWLASEGIDRDGHPSLLLKKKRV